MPFLTDYALQSPAWKRLHDGPMPVRTHTGAGDTILQAGLMVRLSERYGKIAVPCYAKYWSLGTDLYTEHPDISLYAIPNQHPGNLCSPPDSTFDAAYAAYGLDKDQEIRIGEYAGEGLYEDFAKGFYVQSGVEYRHRWDSDPTPRAVKSVSQFTGAREPRIFVHDDASRSLIIHKMVDNHSVFRPDPRATSNILQYGKMLIEADEIHCIDSAFFCLANQLPCRGKLFYHHYSRPERSPEFRHELRLNWEWVL